MNKPAFEWSGPVGNATVKPLARFLRSIRLRQLSGAREHELFPVLMEASAQCRQEIEAGAWERVPLGPTGK